MKRVALYSLERQDVKLAFRAMAAAFKFCDPLDSKIKKLGEHSKFHLVYLEMVVCDKRLTSNKRNKQETSTLAL